MHQKDFFILLNLGGLRIESMPLLPLFWNIVLNFTFFLNMVFVSTTTLLVY